MGQPTDYDEHPPWAALPQERSGRGEEHGASSGFEVDGAGDGQHVDQQVEQAMRWRLVLGKFADDRLGQRRLTRFQSSADEGVDPDGDDGVGWDETGHGESDQEGGLGDMMGEGRRMDGALEYIYDREYARRAHRTSSGHGGSGLSVPAWLSGVRELFPSEAVHVIERDALQRYGMTELVTDPDILREAERSDDLLKAILQFKHMMKGDVLDAARDVVKEVVAMIAERLVGETRAALTGAHEPDLRPPPRTFRNTDWKKTILRNLKNYDQERERLIADRIFYKHRTQQKSTWTVIVAVDQSGSMMDSLIHSAVMAAIFAALPNVKAHLVLWDTRVVDVSDMVDDPMEVLMGCQLGGGTQMLPAMQYCSGLITEPDKTIFVLISDWFIWGEVPQCLALAHELVEAGVRGVGLCALDADANPVYDEKFARDLADVGWFVAAMTPKKLAEHIGKIIA